MSLDKSIQSGKEKRKPYRGSKAFDCTCRNHGSCPYCLDTRTKKFREQDKSAKEEIKEWKKHIHKDGARFHVLWWDLGGTHCSEKNCEMNKPK